MTVLDRLMAAEDRIAAHREDRYRLRVLWGVRLARVSAFLLRNQTFAHVIHDGRVVVAEERALHGSDMYWTGHRPTVVAWVPDNRDPLWQWEPEMVALRETA